MAVRGWLFVLLLPLLSCAESDGITGPCGIGQACAGDEVASVQLTIPPGPFLAGDTTMAAAVVRDAQGATIAAPVAFVSSDTAVATVDQTGRIQARSTGTTVITARAGNREAAGSFQVVTFAPASIGVGEDLACLTGDVPGRHFCWGLGDAGQLGFDSDTTCFADDTLVAGPVGCAIAPRRFSPELSLVSVSAGDSLACAVGAGGEAYCWGANTFGQLGSGGQSGGPQRVTAVGGAFTSVSAGGRHACGIAGGTAYCWGEDSLGQLGDARRINSTTPIPVVTSETFVMVSAGFRHTCALNDAGAAFCWGNDESGQLGRGTIGSSYDTPQAVSGGHAFSMISAGDSSTCGVRSDGTVLCWGANSSGQLGSGSGAGASGVPTAIGGTYSAVCVGRAFACALDQGGAAFCWGHNDYGQIGSSGGNLSTPNAVSGGLTFVAIDAGARHACERTAGGEVHCWGSNVFGALGNSLQAAARGTPVGIRPFPAAGSARMRPFP